LKTNYQILITFGRNILDTTGHHVIVYVPALLNVCFCTTWGKQNKQNITHNNVTDGFWHFCLF